MEEKMFVLKVPGRLYKIDVNYRPIKVEESAGKTAKIDTKPYLRIMEEIDVKVYCFFFYFVRN